MPLYQLVLTLGANRGTGRKPLSMGKDGRRWKKKQEIVEIFLQVNDILLWLSGQLDTTTGLMGNLWHLKTCSQLVGPPMVAHHAQNLLMSSSNFYRTVSRKWDKTGQKAFPAP